MALSLIFAIMQSRWSQPIHNSGNYGHSYQTHFSMVGGSGAGNETSDDTVYY